jgi:hypothetical protein
LKRKLNVISPKAEEVADELLVILAVILGKLSKPSLEDEPTVAWQRVSREEAEEAATILKVEWGRVIQKLIDETFAESFAGGANATKEIERDGKT